MKRSKRTSIQVGQHFRKYRVQYPQDTAKGLIFAFHGFTETALAFERSTGLSPVAVQAGVAVVYPRGLFTSWYSAFGGREQDLAFFDALYGELVSELGLDSSQVYLTGISDGAYFANWIGMKRSSQIAAVCSHSGGVPKEFSEVDKLNLPNPYRVLIIQGDQDNLVKPPKAEALRDLYIRSGHSVQYRLISGLRHQWADSLDPEIVSFFLGSPVDQVLA